MPMDRPAVSLRRRLFWLAAVAILPVALMSALALQALFAQQREHGDAELRGVRTALEVLASSRSLEFGDEAAFETRFRREWAVPVRMPVVQGSKA